MVEPACALRAESGAAFRRAPPLCRVAFHRTGFVRFRTQATASQCHAWREAVQRRSQPRATPRLFSWGFCGLDSGYRLYEPISNASGQVWTAILARGIRLPLFRRWRFYFHRLHQILRRAHDRPARARASISTRAASRQYSGFYRGCWGGWGADFARGRSGLLLPANLETREVHLFRVGERFFQVSP